MRAFAAVMAALILAGCATEYNQGMGATGGSEVSMITPTRAVVSFAGNGYTSPDRVQQYVLLRAAELTIERGYGHFAVLSSIDDTRSDTFYSGYGNYGFFGTATTVEKPKERLDIEMFSGGKPVGAPPNVFNAAEIINTVRPTLGAAAAPATPQSVPTVSAAQAVPMAPLPVAPAVVQSIAVVRPAAVAPSTGAIATPALAPLATQTTKMPGHRVAGHGCPGFAPRVIYAESPDKLPPSCERVEAL